MRIVKKYEYQVKVIKDRGHLDDPEFLDQLNEMGTAGFKRSEEQAKGSNELVVLFERELVLDPGEEIKIQEKT